uniref:Deoxyuridine 5'-triphosphate nucleotidohydrolase n=1 Tax=Eptatretus burgeri TaxID=7764 RepID=A0A8C4RAM9_EPTBU
MPEAETGETNLRFVKLSGNAIAPTRGSEWAAGFDLYSAEEAEIPSMDRMIVKTDIQISLPVGCYGRIAPRSGLAVKHGLDVGAGVIDADYRGSVNIVLFNFSKKSYSVKKGERIAQLICEKICYPKLQECVSLDNTERGSGGFGSTGKN